MKILCTTLVILAVFGLAEAQVPHLYFAGMLQWSEPVSDFSNGSIGEGFGNANTGTGAEFDVGLMSDHGATYVGIRWAKFDTEGDFVEWDDMTRFIAGLRWHVTGKLATPVVPALGAGISLGKSRLEARDPAFSGVDRRKKFDSQTSVGWFVEGGVRVRLPGALSVFGGLQYHRFDANFEDAFFGGDDSEFDVTFITTQIGIQYTL